jgi:hypothetical protein
MTGRRLDRAVWRSVTTVLVACWFVAAATGTASAVGAHAGALTIIDINGGYGPLTRGGSGSEFLLRLPTEATCPGDSAHDQWRVQTWIVPASVDPLTIGYGLRGPKDPGQWPMFDLYGAVVEQVTLPQNTAAGQPSFIPALPQMTFARFTTEMLPPGTYRVGVACTLFREMASYWDVEIVVEASAADKPGGFVWHLAGAPATSTPASSNATWWFVGAGALTVLVVGLVLVLRSRRHSHPTPEPSTPPRSSAPDALKEPA